MIPTKRIKYQYRQWKKIVNASGNGPIFTLFLDADGYLFSCGSETEGQLCDGLATSSRSSPVAVASDKRWLDIEVSSLHAIGLDTKSYAWCWGCNTGLSAINNGQLGDNTTFNRSSPVSVVGDRQFIAISTMGYYGLHTLAIDSKSYAWAWGAGNQVCLGDNTDISKSSPVSVVGDRQFITISAGTNVSAALDTKSYAWCWGINVGGQLGNNTTFSQSSPVSVVGDRQWVAIQARDSMCVALDDKSYAWAWGSNFDKLLGDNTANNRSSPVSVVGGKQWKKIAASGFCVIGIDSQGYAWGWGNGNTLGDGTTNGRSSPVSVLVGPVVDLWNGARPTFYLDNYGKNIWKSGTNNSGCIGDGTTNSYSSPTSMRFIGKLF